MGYCSVCVGFIGWVWWDSMVEGRIGWGEELWSRDGEDWGIEKRFD